MEYKWIVLTVTTVGVLMAGLDTRIVIIGLPQVTAALGADAEQAVWFTQAYVLCSTISLLLIGRATDIIGRMKIYTAGFGVFTLGSLLLSLYFQLVLGLSPFDAGIRILPIDIAFLLVGPLSGRLSDKYGHMPFTTAGLALSSTSLFFFSTTNAATPYSLLIIYLVMFGAGVGLFSSPNMSSLMGSVPTSRRGIASAVRAVFFQTGSVISINSRYS